MRIFIASEFRCTVYENKYYLAPKAYTIYKRYADAFGDVVLCCRYEETTQLMEGYKEAAFVKKAVPIYSLYDALVGKYKKVMLPEIAKSDLVIARIPSIIAYRAADYAQEAKIPYLAEMMGDAWDSYWNHDISGKCIALYMYRKMEKVAWNANYAIYVTEKYLQRRYPCKNGGISASNVVIKNVEQFVLDRRLEKIRKIDKKHISLMTTAAVNVLPKGQQFVIRAINVLKKHGIEVKYFLAGGGEQNYLRKLAKSQGVEENVIFLGELTIEEIYKYLDVIDIYIQPSLQEGLPRAVIEAMSRGCPCLGSRTAGTPELLESKFIFERASVKAIEKAVVNILDSNLERIAKRNFEFSKEYREEILDGRRNGYFRKIKAEIVRREV